MEGKLSWKNKKKRTSDGHDRLENRKAVKERNTKMT